MGALALSVGNWTNRADILLEASLTDADGDAVRLELEVRAIDIPFSNLATTSGSLVPSGTLASIIVPGLSVGEYHWQARAVDVGGRPSAWTSFGGNADGVRDFGIEQTSPVLAATVPAFTSSNPVTVPGTASDGSGITSVSWVNTTSRRSGLASGTTSWTASIPLIPGVNTLVFFAWDAAGNATTSTALLQHVPSDNFPPGLFFQTPTTGAPHTASATPLAVGGTAFDSVALASIKWTNQDTGTAGPAALVGTAWSASIPLAFGSNRLWFTVFDEAGHDAVFPLSVTFDPISDSAAPSVAITGPTPAATSSPIVLSGTASDDVGVSVVRWTNLMTGGGGVADNVGPWSASVGLIPGLNNLVVTARDAAGKESSDTLAVTFTPALVDDLPPAIVLLTPTPGGFMETNGSPVLVEGAAADEESLAEVVWSNGTNGMSGTAGGGAPWRALVVLQPGNNLVAIKAIDAAGNVAAIPVTIVYTPPPPPFVPGGDDGDDEGGGRFSRYRRNCGLLGIEAITILLALALVRRRPT
jgi:hypothetical protein